MSTEEKQITLLRESVRSAMSERRFYHTLEVEKMAVRLGELYAPEKLFEIRAAALLHDITKEKSTEEHIDILSSHNVEISAIDRLSEKTLHSRTAELVILYKYPEFAQTDILCAVRRHTTGQADMTLLDAIIYLADYIDMSRKFDDCVRIREYFWGKEPDKMSMSDRLIHLWQTLLLSFDITLKALVEEGAVISSDTVDARNSIICRLKG